MSRTEELLARITELEHRLEYSDETIAQLNDQLARHQQQLFELNKKLDLLITRLKEGGDAMADPGEEPPPPHY